MEYDGRGRPIRGYAKYFFCTGLYGGTLAVLRGVGVVGIAGRHRDVAAMDIQVSRGLGQSFSRVYGRLNLSVAATVAVLTGGVAHRGHVPFRISVSPFCDTSGVTTLGSDVRRVHRKGAMAEALRRLRTVRRRWSRLRKTNLYKVSMLTISKWGSTRASRHVTRKCFTRPM